MTIKTFDDFIPTNGLVVPVDNVRHRRRINYFTIMSIIRVIIVSLYDYIIFIFVVVVVVSFGASISSNNKDFRKN
jgi:hypothetical protein